MRDSTAGEALMTRAGNAGMLHARPSRAQFEAPRNAVLAALSSQEYRRLWPEFERVELTQDQVLHQPGGRMRHAIFPEQGLISLTTYLQDGNSVEVAVIGTRGFVGIPLIFGKDKCPYEAFVQIAGSAIIMKAEAFVREFQRGGPFQAIALAYLRCRTFMMSQYAACNRLHDLGRRLPRLLLRIHDELGCQDFAMTHERMSALLGAARPEVAKHAAMLRQAGIIDYQRCKIKILDRKKLESASCECYSLIADELNRIFLKRK